MNNPRVRSLVRFYRVTTVYLCICLTIVILLLLIRIAQSITQ